MRSSTTDATDSRWKNVDEVHITTILDSLRWPICVILNLYLFLHLLMALGQPFDLICFYHPDLSRPFRSSEKGSLLVPGAKTETRGEASFIYSETDPLNSWEHWISSSSFLFYSIFYFFVLSEFSVCFSLLLLHFFNNLHDFIIDVLIISFNNKSSVLFVLWWSISSIAS